MSKSLGNLVLVRNLLNFRTPDALRLHLAGFHYRDSWEHDDGSLEAAEELASRLRRADTALANGTKSSPDPHPWLDRFLEAMGNDLKTPSAVRILGELAGEILEAERKDRKIGKAQEVLRTLGGVLGLRLGRQGPDPRVVRGWSRHSLRFEEERSAVNGGEDL